MISIICNQCKTTLTIDDAFAGGVCRCQHCGTIQTVPAHFKGNADAPAAPVAPAPSKSLFLPQGAVSAGTSPGAGAAPSGLDELAQIVASSGLSGSGLHSARLQRAGAAPEQAPAPAATESLVRSKPQKKLPLVPLAIGAGVVIVALAAAVIFLALRNAPGSSSSTSDSGGGGGGSGSATFCGMNISGNSVIYVLDRGNSIRDEFDSVKEATYRSIGTLGPDRKFAVILWNNGGDDVAFPAQGLRNATTDQISQLKGAIEDVIATGSSHIGGALERAAARNPSTVVIVTAKDKLEDEDVDALNAARENAGGKIKFYTLVVGAAQDNAALKNFTKATSGQYRRMDDSELKALLQ